MRAASVDTAAPGFAQMAIHGLRRTATDLLRGAAVDPVAAKAIIGHTTDRMREHYSALVPALKT